MSVADVVKHSAVHCWLMGPIKKGVGVRGKMLLFHRVPHKKINSTAEHWLKYKAVTLMNSQCTTVNEAYTSYEFLSRPALRYNFLDLKNEFKSVASTY